MKSLVTKFTSRGNCEWVLVFFSIIQGLYVFSPLYDYSVSVNGLTPFAAALAHPVLVYVYAGLLIITAIAMAYGLIKNKSRYRAAGLLGQFSIRLYNVLTTILTVGLFPLIWTYAATVVGICGVLWIAERLDNATS